jgi:hypothetical protein
MGPGGEEVAVKLAEAGLNVEDALSELKSLQRSPQPDATAWPRRTLSLRTRMRRP